MRALIVATLTSLILTAALGLNAIATPEAGAPTPTAAAMEPPAPASTDPEDHAQQAAPQAPSNSPTDDPAPETQTGEPVPPPVAAPAPALAPAPSSTPVVEPISQPASQQSQEIPAAPGWHRLTPQEALTAANRYLTDLGSLRARFQQISPDGHLTTGTAYLKKPGRARFDYDAPTPITIIADGFWVALVDDEAGTQDRYPLSATPLAILLDKGTDISKIATLEEVEQGENLLRLHLKSREEPGLGTLILTFTRAPFDLVQWTVIDAQGYRTRVLLSQLEPGATLNPNLFHIDVMNPNRRRQ